VEKLKNPTITNPHKEEQISVLAARHLRAELAPAPNFQRGTNTSMEPATRSAKPKNQ
jgi:hypothetical protein